MAIVSIILILPKKYIDSNNDLYYYCATGQIRKVGSNFIYANGDVSEVDGLIHITYGSELYVYRGEELIIKGVAPSPTTNIDDMNIIYLEKENDLIYRKDVGVVNHGSGEYDDLEDVHLVKDGVGSLKNPIIVDVIDDYDDTKTRTRRVVISNEVPYAPMDPMMGGFFAPAPQYMQQPMYPPYQPYPQQQFVAPYPNQPQSAQPMQPQYAQPAPAPAPAPAPVHRCRRYQRSAH